MPNDLVPTSYLICDAPLSGWYDHGMPAYDNNLAMAQHKGGVPDHERLLSELENMRETYRKAGLHVLRMPFSPYLEVEGIHDGIFVTDPGVSTLDNDGKTQAFIANFSETRRSLEAEVFRSVVDHLCITAHELPPDAKLEGGEVHYTPNDRLYFGGLDRANEAGHQCVIDRSDVADSVFIQSNGFHLDTVLCPVMDTRGKTVAVLACDEVLKEKGREALKAFSDRNNIEILALEGHDSIGTTVDGNFEGGSYAVNCMPVPGKLIGPAPFATPGVADRLEQLGIEHLVTPLTQCSKSAGGNHCLTHQFPGTEQRATDGLFDAFYHEQLKKVLTIYSHSERTHDKIERVLKMHLGKETVPNAEPLQ